MLEGQTSKMQHLELLFKKYADVPKEVIVKEDILRDGLSFTEKALAFDPRHKTYQLFSWDFSKVEEMSDRLAPVKIPDILEIHNGLYSLRRTRVRPRIRVDSPYLVDIGDGKLAICDRLTGSRMIDIIPFPPEPKYFSKMFDDGTLYREISGPDLDIIVFRQCQYWGANEECKFCDINANARAKLEAKQVSSIRPKKVEQVAEVVEEILLREDFPVEYRPFHIHINGGSIIRKLNGLSEVDFYLEYVDAIRERVGNRWPILLQTQPFDKATERMILRDHGPLARSSNYEVWDKRLFAIICPGKDKYISRDEWIKRLIDQVDIWGEGNVCPGFVAGVEMAQPWGFKTVEEAVRSTTEGMDFLMAHGVIPRPISWCVEALSSLGGAVPPPVDYFVRVDQAWFELWRKYGLPPQMGCGQVGPGLAWYPNTGAFDMGLV